MTDAILEYLAESIRRYTAFRAWFGEILILYAVFMLARTAAEVWTGIVLEGQSPWFAWWGSYDMAGSFADDSVALAISLTALVEGSFLFLAKKRIAIAREDGLEEGREAGRAEGRDEARAELEPIIRDLQERIRQLENGRGDPDRAESPAQ